MPKARRVREFPPIHRVLQADDLQFGKGPGAVSSRRAWRRLVATCYSARPRSGLVWSGLVWGESCGKRKGPPARSRTTPSHNFRSLADLSNRCQHKSDSVTNIECRGDLRGRPLLCDGPRATTRLRAVALRRAKARGRPYGHFPSGAAGLRQGRRLCARCPLCLCGEPFFLYVGDGSSVRLYARSAFSACVRSLFPGIMPLFAHRKGRTTT
jgi:hypothetical protein